MIGNIFIIGGALIVLLLLLYFVLKYSSDNGAEILGDILIFIILFPFKVAIGFVGGGGDSGGGGASDSW